MSNSLYPTITDEKDVLPFLKEITRIRQDEDVPDFYNLTQRFVSGRVTNRVPSSATDVLATDNLGDIVNDTNYEYKLVNISGTYKWDRRSLNVAW